MIIKAIKTIKYSFILPVVTIFLTINSFSQVQKNSIRQKNINSLIQKGKLLVKTNPDSTILIINEATKLINDKTSEEYIETLWFKGMANYLLNNIDSSKHYFLILKEESKKNQYIGYHSDALKMIALIYRAIGDYEKSIQTFKECIKFSKNKGLIDKQAAALNNLGVVFEETGNFSNSFEVQMKSLNIYQELKDTFGLMASLNNIGMLYQNIKEYKKADEFYHKVLTYAEKKGSIEHKSRTYVNIGVIHSAKKEYDKALEYFFKALKLKKEIGNNYEAALILENIGEVFLFKENYEQAEKYYLKAYKLFQQYGNFEDKITINLNLAKIFIINKKITKAKKHLRYTDSLFSVQPQKSLFPEFYKINSLYYESIGNLQKSLENQKLFIKYKDSIYSNELNSEIAKQKAIFDYESQQKEIAKLKAETELNKIKSEKQQHKIENNNYIIIAIVIIIIFGLISFFIVRRQLNKSKEATKLLKDNRKILLKKNYEITLQHQEIKSQTEQLYGINDDLMQLKTAIDETDNAVVILDKEGNFEWGNKGFDRLYDIDFNDFIKKYPNILDASKNSSNYEIMAREINKCIKYKTSGNYEFSTFSRNGEKIWIQTNIKAITDLSGNIQNLIVIDTDVSEKVKTGRILEQKNYKLEKQKEEIDSSLRYAQTIQKAILPAPLSMKKNNDFFLVYLPKDIVSGDFYWFSDPKNSPYTYFAIVDCTGHGVPGAFMSMIGARILNFIVNEKKIEKPAEILEQMHISVKIALKQKMSGNRDGMDISLCRIERKGNGKKEIIYSGAKQSIYYYKSNKNELIRVRGDVKTIGGHYYDEVDFTEKEFTLSTNDMLYLMTDGFIDQDSSDGKKIGSSGLKKLLYKIANLPLNQQKEIFLKFFNNHKENTYQRDDITFLGLKIE